MQSSKANDEVNADLLVARPECDINWREGQPPLTENRKILVEILSNGNKLLILIGTVCNFAHQTQPTFYHGQHINLCNVKRWAVL